VPVRAVSLVPSVTETLLAWGITPVACTRFCEQPILPHVGGTKDPDVDAIIRLAPDVVVVDEEENRREDAEALQAAGLTVHVMAVRSLDDLNQQLVDLAERVDVTPPAASTLQPRPLQDVDVWVPIWRRPWMTIGGDTYGSVLLTAAGATNVFEHSAVRYPEITLEEAAALDPDVVLAPTEPYRFGERHRSELEQIAPVVFVDGKDLFWWGARTAGALARLSELIERLASS
jgi:ABC-type Fe3+-hydroxamate transport system substrate-binding protein